MSHRILIPFFFSLLDPLFSKAPLLSSNNVNNKAPEMEYWTQERHQWLETRKLTTTTDATADEDLIPTFKKEANTTIITSAGQTVYLHCHVVNLGEREVG